MVSAVVCRLSDFRGQSFGEASQMAVPGCADIDSEHFRTHLPGSYSGLKYSPPPPAFGKEQERPCQQAPADKSGPGFPASGDRRSPPVLWGWAVPWLSPQPFRKPFVMLAISPKRPLLLTPF